MLHKLKNAKTRNSLYSTNTRSNGGLGHDLEQTDLACVVAMGTAAKLGGEVAHLNHTYDLAVFFTEESHSAVLTRSLNVGLNGIDTACSENVYVNQGLNLFDLLRGKSGKVCKVKAAYILTYVRSGLLYVIAKHSAESRLKQMARGVISHNGSAALAVDLCGNSIAYLYSTVCNGAKMNVNAVGFLGIINGCAEALGIYATDIADLTAALAVEGSAIENK